MLTTLTLLADATPEDCASAVRDAWPHSRVVHLSGLTPQEDLRDFYGRMFELVGYAAPLAEDATVGDREVQRTGEVWTQVRYDPSIPDAYRHSANPQPLHTDGSYIPDFPNAGFLACKAMPMNGGATTFIDGRDVVAALESEAPDLLQRVLTTVIPHARSGDRRVEPLIRFEGDEPIMNWNYYCVDMSAEPEALALREEIFAFLDNSPAIQAHTQRVKLKPGEAVLWKDDRLLHGRDGFDPEIVSDRFLWKAQVQVNE
jgi:alpha-ketoglutarate-dependent taurine dioxygenase